MEAAIGVIAAILGPVQFGCRDDLKRHVQRFGKGAGLLQIAAGEAGRIGKHGEHAVAQHAMSGRRKESRIHSAGVGDHEAAERARRSSSASIFAAVSDVSMGMS